jgi:hypothetical protein
MADRKLGESAGNRGKGRKKGVPNKATAALKDAILNAFSQVGGEAYLVTVAQTDPKTFCTLLGKVLPLQVTGADDGPVKLVVEWQRPE